MLNARSVLAAGLGATLSLHALGAEARPEYPDMIAASLQMPCTPQCTICHIDLKGGYNTLRPGGMGLNLRDNCELTGSNPDSLQPALDCAAADPAFDTDHDGTPDITELKAGDDPNGPGSVCGGSSEGPTYGCVRVAPHGHVDGVAGLAAAATLLVGIAAIRRRPRR